MSRTYRRKNGWDHPTYDFIFTEEGYIKKYYYSKDSKEYLLDNSKYHRDHPIYGTCVPHWFVNLYSERPLRRKTQATIQKWLANPTEEGIICPKRMRDAGWNYW